jgi:DNA-directed RNA polymerase specialized sigma subunit
MKKDSLIVILEKIRSGDMQLRKKFIEENSKFIAKTVSKTLGKSAVPKNSEEFELGLSAFNYSIDDFDLKSGEDFLNLF